MNYYEELGVTRSATTAEIQKAYKALVCILHPDQQRDEKLRQLSGLQLRRLNQMISVLADPQKRRSYDLSLDEAAVPTAVFPAPEARVGGIRVRVRLRFSRRTFAWAVIVLILIASAILSYRQPVPVDLPLPDRPTTAAAEKPRQNKPRVEFPATIRASDTKPDRDQEPAPPMATEWRSRPAPAPAIETPAPPSEPPRRVEPVKNAEETPPPAEAVPAAHLLTGKWLYVPRSADPSTNLYPAQYIEMRIQDSGGMLHGRYYAKYKVRNLAISPEMMFQFEGKAGDRTSVLAWSSTFGSRGELRLKRVTDESLEVNWITTEFGRRDVLASGTAVLYRSDP